MRISAPLVRHPHEYGGTCFQGVDNLAYGGKQQAQVWVQYGAGDLTIDQIEPNKGATEVVVFGVLPNETKDSIINPSCPVNHFITIAAVRHQLNSAHQLLESGVAARLAKYWSDMAQLSIDCPASARIHLASPMK